MSELALKLIAENKAKHARGEDARVLELGNCGLTGVPEELLELIWLEELIFSSQWYNHNANNGWKLFKSQNPGIPNYLTNLPKKMFQLINLKKLIIRSTEISDLMPVSRLANLQELYCDFSQVTDLSPLSQLSRLEKLDCSSTQISDLSPISSLSCLKLFSCSSTQVSDLSPLSGLSKLEELYCHSTQISDLSPLSTLNQLKELDCDSTKILDLSSLSSLSQLSGIDCRSTQISDLSPLSSLNQLEALYCSSTQISDLSPISALYQLKELYCGSTQISDLSFLSNLSQLEILNCSSTQVSDLSPLSSLSHLKELYCDSTQISDLSPISSLVQLIKLDCGSTQISDLSPLAGLIQLDKLNCRSTQISDLSSISGLIELRELYCSSTQVSDLSPITALSQLKTFSCRDTKISDLSPLTQLIQLKELDCASTQVSDLSPVARLSNLRRLFCFMTPISDLSPLSQLNNLNILSCFSTQISNLSPLTELHNLQIIHCFKTQISDLSPILTILRKGVEVKWQNFGEFNSGRSENAWKSLPVILVKDCPLTNPPVEIAQQGSEAILRYFEEKERLEKFKEVQPTLIKVREAKVLIVGQGKSGKTTLRRKLENPAAKMPARRDTTRGIEITRLEERMPHTDEALRLNLWDFGGQDIQYYAHQFFLTGSSLYVLVTNERIQDKVYLPYWLNIIEMLGKKSPVILIQNKDGGHCQPLKDEAAIRARFSNVHNRVFQSDFSKAKTEAEFSALRKKIIELASELPHIEKEYLRSFDDLRKKLEVEAKLERHYLRWNEYCALMPELNEDLMRDYANAFAFLGVCQYFPDDALLSSYVFLRPKWLIDALFDLLLHPGLEKTRGLFSERDTLKIWKAPEYRDMHPLLVRMMKEFELCYRVEGDEEKFIIPQRLPSENNNYGWEPEYDIPLQFHYKFMPKGILTRLICRLHARIENDPIQGQRIWNDAVVFTLPDGKGRVFAREVFSENIIELRATGEKHAEIFNEVIRKMDDINGDAKYDNLQVEKMVPCPCNECQAAEESERFFFKFSVLEKALDKKISDLRCDKSLDTIKIEDIFGKSGVKKPQARQSELSFNDAESRMRRVSVTEIPIQRITKIFLASSAELKNEREKIEIEINRLNKKHHQTTGVFFYLSIWEDGKNLSNSSFRSQDNYNEEVDDCHIFMLLFYSKLGKFTREEFDRARARQKGMGSPQIWIFQKDVALPQNQSRQDAQSRFDFLDELKGADHFPNLFKNTDSLIKSISENLETLIRSKA